jgi:hypothetical protein
VSSWMILIDCIFLDLLNIFLAFAFDMIYQSDVNVWVIFPGSCLGVDNTKVHQSSAYFEVHCKVFLFGSEGLDHDSEYLVQLS